MQTLQGRAGLVTGAGSGVGKALALRLAKLGATVYLVGRREAALEAVAGEAHDACGRAVCAVSVRAEANVPGVRVLSVYLGRTATPMQRHVHELDGQPNRPGDLIQPDDVASTVIHALCLPPNVAVTEIGLRPMRKPG